MKLGDFIKRIFIYNISFTLIYFNIFQSEENMITKANEFKKNLIFLGEIAKLNDKTLTLVKDVVQTHHLLVYEFLFGALCFFSFISLFTQKKLFNCIFTILFAFISAVLYNPFLPENKIASPFGIRRELILSVGICIVMLANIFNVQVSTIEQESNKGKEVIEETRKQAVHHSKN
jgi:hypothetical protein